MRTRALCLVVLLCGGCGLVGLFEPSPPGECDEPGRQEQRGCGPCGLGVQQWECGPSFRWVTTTECEGNPYDLDRDGFANERCYTSGGAACCGQADCDDDNPLRNPDHPDLDGDGHEAASCGGDDCNDDDPGIWTADPAFTVEQGFADRDGDGYVDARCCTADEECGGDCDDDDPLRWTGHADLDGDGHESEGCGGLDCDDDHPERWTGHADADGDGYDAPTCGGDDCNDEDPFRWAGHADLDHDGLDEARCGGTDCDDDCYTCRPPPTGEPTCGMARDHDCDGLVDELSGCGECTPGEPWIMGEIDTGDSRDVFVSGDYVYVASAAGLHIVRMVGRGVGSVLSTVEIADATDVFVYGGYAYVTSLNGLFVIDLIIDLDPVLVTGPVATGDSRGVFVSGSRAYVASATGLYILDVWDPTNPELVTVIEHGYALDSRAVFIDGNRAYVATNNMAGACNGLYWVDLEPSEGWPSSWLCYGLTVTGGTGVFVSGDEIYVSGMTTLSVYQPPLWPGWVVTPLPDGYGHDVFVSDRRAYVATRGGLSIVDVSHLRETSFTSPEPSVLVAETLDTGESRGVFVSNGMAYVATDRGLVVVDLDCTGEQ